MGVKITTPLKSIRAFCVECQGGNQKATILCISLDCALYAYRQGKNPARKGIGGRQGIKRNGKGIMPTQVGKTEKIIEVRGNKRVIIRIEDISGMD